MMMILITLIMLNSFIFMMMNTPLSLGFMLMIQTLLFTLIMSITTFNFFYLYILFLVMIGAMLILLIYVSTLSSNKMFKLKSKTLIISSISFFFILLSTKIINMKFMNFNNNMDFIFNYEINNNFNLIFSLNKLYNKPSNQMMILLINYLLITLFIVVKIINIKMGPLRKNF
uniref:NADH-ubiquinone oxidoreductase chain 6 n=1 Tax=Neostromboceros nipponicus TaxID=2805799 RepID=A0A8A6C331_9HYME|nr:NADH dehydrogenase subunit 6 [Neostromboceros nipponicus]QTH79157.1 NADH dehydrogenase subunit 6 [Neostromboceros nipponicus]UQS76355.1 NADH dehydrogenase subunit 6 [Neostromboceros nipponicus]